MRFRAHGIVIFQLTVSPSTKLRMALHFPKPLTREMRRLRPVSVIINTPYILRSEDVSYHRLIGASNKRREGQSRQQIHKELL